MQLTLDDWLLLLNAVVTTLKISAWTLLIALPLGCLLGILRYLRLGFVSNLVAVIVDAIRAVPLVFYVVAIFLIVPAPALVQAILALSTHTAASICEITRGGLQSLDPDQLRMAKVLGLPLRERLLHVALPQAARSMLPALVNQASVVIKDTTLVSIGVIELTKAVQILNMRHLSLSLEFLILIAAFYFVLCQTLTLTGLWLEKRWSIA